MRFVVYGAPQPQGSKRAIVRHGRAHVIEDNAKTLPWRQQITQTALASGLKPIPRPRAVQVDAVFYFARPKSFKALGKTTKPDVDKLLRAVLDALTGVGYEDDAQVVQISGKKVFDPLERVVLFVEEYA